MAVETLEPESGVAGGYAQGRYDAGLKSWRRALWKAFVLTSLPMMAFGLVVYGFNQDAWLPWFAGAIFGVGASLLIFFRDEPPAYLRHWREGAQGERLTAKELARLDPSVWRVLHDVQVPGRKANYDHIVVGPAGVFLIETKHWQGYLEVSDGAPVLKQRHDQEADKPLRPLAWDTMRQAIELKEHLASHDVRCFVNAVVVPWAEFDAQVVPVEKCSFVAGSSLATWLLSQPYVPRPVDPDAVVAAISGTAFPKSFPRNGADRPQATA